ncbi:MAG: hypothetical protein RBS77_03875 [Candidatus Moranbacteria bacterium]|jgi:hypothetical protein|nr:hypothetical protein [Candidatus Moranbacteria bacterium]
MNDIEVLYLPDISDEEKAIVKQAFKDFNLQFHKYETKGMLGGAFDVEIKFIIDFLNSGGVNAISNAIGILSSITWLSSEIFKRNRKKISDNNTRPRYTILNFNFGSQSINISNVNENNSTNISLVDYDKCIREESEYSEAVLKEYFDRLKK